LVSPVVAALAWCSLPAVVFGVAFHADAVGRALGHALRTVRPPPPAPASASIERLAADLRRLAALIREYDVPGAAVPIPKRIAAHQAYQDRLADACAALGIAHRLGCAPGWENAFEIARVERALLDAGLVFAPPTPHRSHDS
jgi:hypothetical protein